MRGPALTCYGIPLQWAGLDHITDFVLQFVIAIWVDHVTQSGPLSDYVQCVGRSDRLQAWASSSGNGAELAVCCFISHLHLRKFARISFETPMIPELLCASSGGGTLHHKGPGCRRWYLGASHPLQFFDPA